MTAEPGTPLVSVVVTTRNAGRTLKACLDSLERQDYPAFEILVVDNASSDGTPQLSRRGTVRLLHVGGERSRQRNAGLRAAEGSVVVFLDADMVAPSDLLSTIVATRRLGFDALVVPEESVGEGYWAHCRALERRCYTDELLVEAARAFDRRLLERVGGFDEALHAFEDWELHDRCAAAGARIGHARPAGGPVLHDEGRLRLNERVRKGRYYGQALANYLDRPGAQRRLSPMRRTGLFARHARALLRAPHLAAGLLLLKSAEVAAALAHGPTDPYVPSVRRQGKVGER